MSQSQGADYNLWSLVGLFSLRDGWSAREHKVNRLVLQHLFHKKVPGYAECADAGAECVLECKDRNRGHYDPGPPRISRNVVPAIRFCERRKNRVQRLGGFALRQPFGLLVAVNFK